MFKSSFGSKQQVKFLTVSGYYQFLGYLAKNDGSSKIVWENNDDQGAWGKEGRIEFFSNVPTNLKVKLKHTAGNSNIVSRVNCNEFVEHLISRHNFQSNANQNLTLIKKTIPLNYMNDFQVGLNL